MAGDEGGSDDPTRASPVQRVQSCVQRTKSLVRSCLLFIRAETPTRTLLIRSSLSILAGRVFQLATNDNTTDMDYMIQGNTHDDPEPFADEDFRKGGSYTIQVDTPTADNILEGAIKIREHVKDKGEIATDRAVEGTSPVHESITDAVNRDYRYYRRIGPVAASHPDLRWRTIYRLEEDAPPVDTDEFQAKASELDIPERDDILARIVLNSYRHLRKVKDHDDRGAHREELIAKCGVNARPKQYDTAERYLQKLPWVIPPAEDGPAWTLVEDGEEGD